MVKRWFFQSQGQVLGPLEAEEIKASAARGELHPTDPLWPEGGGPEDAIAAEQAIDFPALTQGHRAGATSTPMVPDWLADLAVDPPRSPSGPEGNTPLPRTDALPDWLEDVRLLQPPPGVPLVEEGQIQVEEEVPPPTSDSVELTPEGAEELTIEAAAAAELAEASSVHGHAAMEETWRRVRLALERWIDQESNAGLILAGDAEAALKSSLWR